MSTLAVGIEPAYDPDHLARTSSQVGDMEPISIYEARNNLSRLIEAAMAGEEVILTKRGEPVVKIVRIEPTYTGRALAAWLEANPPRHPRSREELDAMIEALREDWDR